MKLRLVYKLLKKKYILTSIIISTFTLFYLFFYVINDSQSKVTLKIKSLLPKDTRVFLKKTINFYLYNFDTRLDFKKTSNINSSKGKSYLMREYNNKFLDYQGPRAYLESYNKNIFLVTGTGLISYADSNNFFEKKKIKFENIPSNIKNIINYEEFYIDSKYGTKGFLIDEDYFYLSFVNEIKDECFTISIIKAKLNLDYLNFSFLLNTNQCVKKDNDYGEFQPIQSGGIVKNFDNENLILTTGEFRYRDHAQNDSSIFGKVLLIDKSSGDYKIISKGHRNSQGLYYDHESRTIVATEHGPYGGDEINIIKNSNFIPNFGWPISSYGEHYPRNSSKEFYDKAPLYKSHLKFGFVEPIKVFVPSIGITQIVKNENITDKNMYFFASMGYEDRENSLSIHEIVFNEYYTKITDEDKIKINNRVRDLVFVKEKNILLGFLEKKGSIIVIDFNE